MAKNNYQYTTTPRKIAPDYKDNKKRKLEVRETSQKYIIRARKEEKTKRIKQISYVLIAFAILLTISYRNSLINERFNQVQNQKRELATLQKENEQTQVNIQNSINLNNIEQAAKEKLGMQKLTNKQTVYINIPKKDYVESTKEEVLIDSDEGLLKKIIDLIKK